MPCQDIEVGAIFPQCSNDGRAKRHVFVVTRIGGGKNLNDGLGGDHFSPFFASESRCLSIRKVLVPRRGTPLELGTCTVGVKRANRRIDAPEICSRRRVHTWEGRKIALTLSAAQRFSRSKV